jgi:hypothetical protein
VRVEQCASDGEEIGVARIFNLNDTPWILSSANPAVVDLKYVFRANDGERHQAAELSILLNGILVILFDVVREVVDWYSVVLDVFHDQLFGLSKLRWGQAVRLANDGNDIGTRRQALHEFDVQFS